MPAEPAAHPTADTLAAFGLGKLDDGTADTVANHLDTCPDCRRRVAAASADSFTRRLKDAHGRGATPEPNKPLTGLAGSVARTRPPSGIPLPETGVPRELADHPQYQVVKELGRGGMGVVYLARNRLMDRDEVLKVVNKGLLDRPGAMDRFLREIRSAAKLSHPNVVTAHSALQLGDLLVLAMEFVPGEDLGRVVKDRGPLPVPNACYYAYQAALGLQHAFEEGMVHRDIKPGNLMLARGGKKPVVKVLDFGLAKAIREKADDTGLTGSGATLGTPDYIAPEQARDAASADVRADVYSLGCTLYHLLAGRPPFRADSLFEILLHHQHTAPVPLNEVRPEVPAELAAVVSKMMAKDPADRYQTPKEVARALTPFFRPAAAGVSLAETSVPSGTRPDTTAVPAPRSGRPWWGVPAVVLAFVTAGLIGAWAGGVFKVKTATGEIVIEDLPADAVVTVNEQAVTVRWDDGNRTALITAKEGEPMVRAVLPDGTEVVGQRVAIAAGGRAFLRAKFTPSGPPGPAPDDGFVPLFAGTLDPEVFTHGPNHKGPDWLAVNGLLVSRGGGALGEATQLVTRRAYTDFVLRVEVAAPSDDGVVFKFRGPADGSGARYQVATGGLAADGKVYAAGSLNKQRGVGDEDPAVHAAPIPLPPGRPYTIEVTAIGGTIRTTVNGTPAATLRDDQPLLAAGPIQFTCRHGATVRYARIAIKELTAYDTELLRNPGCEEKLVDGKIPGWTAVTGNWIPRSLKPPPRTGDAYFFAGRVNLGVLEQVIDVSRYAAAIDAGRQEFAVQGYVRSHPEHGNADKSRVIVEYFKAGDLKSQTPLAQFDSDYQGGPHNWNPVRIQGRQKAPPQTRQIRVKLMSKVSKAGDFNHGFYDDLSLKALPPDNAPPPDEYALQFDGRGSRVRIPKGVFKFRGNLPLTIEAVVTPAAGTGIHQLVCDTGGSSGLELVHYGALRRWSFGFLGPDGWSRVTNPAPVVPGRRTTLAAVYDRAGGEMRLYVDGKSGGASHRPTGRWYTVSDWDVIIGADPDNPGNRFSNYFAGTVEQVRISKSARYAADYDPPRAMEADADTVVLYLFREGKGTALRDASPNGGDAWIEGGTWVKRAP